MRCHETSTDCKMLTFDQSYFLSILQYLSTIVALHVLLEDSPTSEHIAGTLGSLMAIAVGPLQDLEYVVVNDKYFRVEGTAGDTDPDELSEAEGDDTDNTGRHEIFPGGM